MDQFDLSFEMKYFQYEGLGWLWCCGGRGALGERRQERDKVRVETSHWSRSVQILRSDWLRSYIIVLLR